MADQWGGTAADEAALRGYLARRSGALSDLARPSPPMSGVDEYGPSLSAERQATRPQDAIAGALRYYAGPHLSDAAGRIADLAVPSLADYQSEATGAIDAAREGRYADALGGAGWATLAAIGGIPGPGKPISKAAKALSDLPMDEASRMARAKDLGYSDERFFRGEKGEPMEYPKGAWFTTDPEYAEGFAKTGGATKATTKKGDKDTMREFRLDLSKTFGNAESLTGDEYGRLVAAAIELDPRLARELTETLAPGKSPEWLVQWSKYNPSIEVIPAGFAAEMIERQSGVGTDVLRHAGFDAVREGSKVRKLKGDGIRLADAAFDPSKSSSTNILASLATVLGLGGLATAAGQPGNPSED